SYQSEKNLVTKVVVTASNAPSKIGIIWLQFIIYPRLPFTAQSDIEFIDSSDVFELSLRIKCMSLMIRRLRVVATPAILWICSIMLLSNAILLGAFTLAITLGFTDNPAV